jgi:nucleoside-diphosphate-sugar epimerase
MGRRVLVIGGTKFIGPYVVRQLVAAGYEVTVYHRGQTEAVLPDSVRHVRSPLANMPVLVFPTELLAPPPDVVLHMTPMGEADARAAVQAFRGRAERLVALSSGDVYLAYGRFSGLEPGPVENGPQTEDSPLRSVLYPYRKQGQSAEALEQHYEKILVEREVLRDPELSGTVLRLPKVYGPGSNADLATVYAFRHHPNWRWTHGYVENVAAAIVLAALHPATVRRVYNVGEEHTPTVAERLANLPASTMATAIDSPFNFAQDIVYDTTRLRTELAYAEPVPYQEGIRRTLDSHRD